MRPRDARRNADVRKLKSDNHVVGDFWILIDGNMVTICEQTGTYRRQVMAVPRQTFDALADWYFRDQSRAVTADQSPQRSVQEGK